MIETFSKINVNDTENEESISGLACISFKDVKKMISIIEDEKYDFLTKFNWDTEQRHTFAFRGRKISDPMFRNRTKFQLQNSGSDNFRPDPMFCNRTKFRNKSQNKSQDKFQNKSEISLKTQISEQVLE